MPHITADMGVGNVAGRDLLPIGGTAIVFSKMLFQECYSKAIMEESLITPIGEEVSWMIEKTVNGPVVTPIASPDMHTIPRVIIGVVPIISPSILKGFDWQLFEALVQGWDEAEVLFHVLFQEEASRDGLIITFAGEGLTHKPFGTEDTP
jgi:hypothetical protein